MADDPRNASPKNDPVQLEIKEDAETRAARRELKQSSISDPSPAAAESTAATSIDNKAVRDATPASDAPDTKSGHLKEQVASPKKKRGHDQLGDNDSSDENDTKSVASTDSAKDRTSRLEPEKKRARDEDSKDVDAKPTSDDATKTVDAESKEAHEGDANTSQNNAASSGAFASSTFGKLASGVSPFAVLGSSKGNLFGSGTSKLSFASPPASTISPPTAAPKLTFGGSGGASPFASLSSGANGFGSGLGGSGFGGSGFGSASSGAKSFSSFAAPETGALKSDKPPKPFGAPDSDVEDEDGDDEGDDEAQTEEAERAPSPEKESEEKKRLKLQKVEVNDGEAGEATVISVRAKMFYLDKEVGWKERGAGMLKINVPQACVDFDDTGAVIPGSFDASGLDVDEEDGENNSKGHKVSRLIMRQDQTHRVILNTAIMPAMKFQEKASLKSVGILFTAFEGEQAMPVSITMRMSAANAKSFLNEISLIQRELQGN